MKNLSHSQMSAARPFACRLHSRTEPPINTAASARWGHALSTRKLFQQFTGGDPLKTLCRICLRALCVLLWQSALADVHYVDFNSTNATTPYTSWATAATNIQDAVDAAVAGDEIVVADGTYSRGGRAAGVDSTPNRMAVDKPLSLRSVNGPEFTTVSGGFVSRCAYLTNGATLSGFTLTRGRGYFGGGVRCESRSVVISNCIITSGAIFRNVYISAYGGGAYGGTLNNCMLTRNFANVGGGGAYQCTLNNCTLVENSVQTSTQSDVYGGGAYGCTLNNCALTGNSAVPGSYSVCRYWCETGGEPFCCGGYVSVPTPAYGGGAYSCTLNNCTLTDNSAGVGSGAYGGTLNNCIVLDDSFFSTLNCCWTTDPLFVDQASGNLRLQSNSPCINAGNNAYAPAGPDLDGNPRIAGDTVDIGAYEFQAPVSQISYAWLQQYALPVNSSTDSADPDGDGVDNYHEWLAHSDPTNPFSFPPLLTLIPYGPDVILTWPTNAAGFILQSTTNVGSPPAWVTNSPVPVVIGGQNVIIDHIAGTRQFYRLVH